MPITDIITHVPNIGPTAQVAIGANTPAPYNGATVTAATDGTNVQTATKNMAEIYNRQLFAAKHLIEAAGLVFDPLNWAQQTQAVQAVAGSATPTATDTTQGKVALNLGTAAGDATNATDALTATGLTAILNGTAPNATPNALQAAVANNPSQYGTFASVLAPTAAPTAASPATRLTNSNGEVFDWTGSAWVATANLFAHNSGLLTGAIPVANSAVVYTYSMPRSGNISVAGKVQFRPNTPTGSAQIISLTAGFYLNGNEVIVQTLSPSGDATNATENSHCMAAFDVAVSAGDVLTLSCAAIVAGAAQYNNFSFQYTK